MMAGFALAAALGAVGAFYGNASHVEVCVVAGRNSPALGEPQQVAC